MTPPRTHHERDRPSSTASLDPNVVSNICANQITHLFASHRYPPTSPRSAWQADLPSYIAVALHHSGLDPNIALAAMTLLFRYKTVLPYSVAYYDDAYRLFLAAYMVAAKVTSDPPHALRFWRQVGGGVFGCAELVKMEVELCRVLQYDVQIDRVALAWLKRAARRHGILSEVRGDDESAEDYDDEDEWGEGEDTHLDPPPPSYEDAPHDKRLTLSVFPSMVPPTPKYEEDDDDRMSLTRALEVTEPSEHQDTQALTASPKNKSFIALVKARVVQAVLGRPGGGA